jgi:hypothetical protein
MGSTTVGACAISCSFIADTPSCDPVFSCFGGLLNGGRATRAAHDRGKKMMMQKRLHKRLKSCTERRVQSLPSTTGTHATTKPTAVRLVSSYRRAELLT